MPEPFALRWKLDRPYLELGRAEDVHVLLSIVPDPAGFAQPIPLPMHLVLLVDVSGSMDFLVRHDPTATNLGHGLTEGRNAQRVLSNVPSRREMACAVVRQLAERLQDRDLLTLIAFDDEPYVLAQAMPASQLDELYAAVQQLAKVGGGETHMSRALGQVRQVLDQVPTATHTRKMLLLTDGEDDDPVNVLTMARKLTSDFRLPITAFGTGECKVAFLSELAKTTLNGSFHHIQHESEAERLFQRAVVEQKNVQATNAVLTLWLSPEIQARECYRTQPEILFLGDLRPDVNHQVQLRLEQMERGQAYEVLFRCTLPARAVEQRFRLAKATLTCDLAGMGQSLIETNVIAGYSVDAGQARERSGDVRRVLARAEVQRQVLFLQKKIDAINAGTGSENDRALVAKLLVSLAKKFEEFGDQAQVNQYRDMHREYLARGVVTQEMLNRSLAASSRAEALAVAQDLDF